MQVSGSRLPSSLQHHLFLSSIDSLTSTRSCLGRNLILSLFQDIHPSIFVLRGWYIQATLCPHFVHQRYAVETMRRHQATPNSMRFLPYGGQILWNFWQKSEMLHKNYIPPFDHCKIHGNLEKYYYTDQRQTNSERLNTTQIAIIEESKIKDSAKTKTKI